MVATAQGSYGFAPLSLEALDRRIRQLPAEERARLAWAPIELRETLASLASAPSLDGEQVRALALTLARVSRSIFEILLDSASALEEIRFQFTNSWEADLKKFEERLDRGTRVVAEWTARGWAALSLNSLDYLSELRASDEAHAAVEQMNGFTDDQLAGPGSPLRVQALLMGAIEFSRDDSRAELTARFVARAFDELFVILYETDIAHRHVELYPAESSDERLTRIRSYVDTLRSDDLESQRNRWTFAIYNALRHITFYTAYGAHSVRFLFQDRVSQVVELDALVKLNLLRPRPPFFASSSGLIVIVPPSQRVSTPQRIQLESTGALLLEDVPADVLSNEERLRSYLRGRLAAFASPPRDATVRSRSEFRMPWGPGLSEEQRAEWLAFLNTSGAQE